jgi:hypothetical protein
MPEQAAGNKKISAQLRGDFFVESNVTASWTGTPSGGDAWGW